MVSAKDTYRQRREQGICVSCGQVAKQGWVRCQICLDKNAESSKKKRAKRYEEFRCQDCGISLRLFGIDYKKAYCVNCQERRQFSSLLNNNLR